MAHKPYQQSVVGGMVLSLSAAAAGAGDTVAADGHGALLVRNGGAAPITVTVVVPGNTKYGQPQPDVQTAPIPAGGIGMVGPFPADLADPTDGYVHLTYSDVTSVDVAAIRV